MADALNHQLQSLRESGGLDLVGVVSSDGLLIDSAHAQDMDAESLSALAASGLLMMDALGQELGQGTANQAILEFSGSLVVLMPLDDQLLLVAIARGESNLGRIRLVLRRAMPDLTTAASAI